MFFSICDFFPPELGRIILRTLEMLILAQRARLEPLHRKRDFTGL